MPRRILRARPRCQEAVTVPPLSGTDASLFRLIGVPSACAHVVGGAGTVAHACPLRAQRRPWGLRCRSAGRACATSGGPRCATAPVRAPACGPPVYSRAPGRHGIHGNVPAPNRWRRTGGTEQSRPNSRAEQWRANTGVEQVRGTGRAERRGRSFPAPRRSGLERPAAGHAQSFASARCAHGVHRAEAPRHPARACGPPPCVGMKGLQRPAAAGECHCVALHGAAGGAS